MKSSKLRFGLVSGGAALTAAIIGCGGGGATNTTSATNGNANAGATAATTGTAGTLPGNVILYSRSDGFNETIYRIDPDGSNNQVYATLPTTEYASFGPSSADNRVAFAFTSGGPFSQEYGVFVNTTPDISGATTVDAGPYTFVGSVQFTPDGTKVVYVAQTASGNAGIYVANADGTGTPVRLDDADDCQLSPSGTKLVYSRFFSNSEICLRNIDGSGFARLTSNSTQEFLPQWSKDGLQIFFTSDRTGANAVWRMTADGLTPTQVSAGNDEFTGSPNNDASKVAFVRLSNNSAETGVYTVNVNGSNETPLAVNTDTNPFVYWTSSVGRSLREQEFAFSRLSPRDLSHLRSR